MSSRDNLANPRQSLNESRRVERDARRSGQEYQSVRRGAHRVITAAGDPLAALGHIGGKSGLLVNVGGEWRTVQEHVESRVGAGTQFLANRVSDLEGRMTSAESGVTYTANRVSDVEGRMSGAEGRLTSAESGVTYTANRVSDVEGRMANAEASLNGKASASYVSSMNGRLNAVIDYAVALEEYVRSQHPGKVSVTPPVKG